MSSLEDKLAGWTGPSSATEQEKQERTERMIREAVNAHEPFQTLSRKVYAKGSYANNTNVRSDSDVDIAVECENVIYFESHEPGVAPASTPYKGEWTPEKLRRELIAALQTKFGSAVDASGTTAIQVHSTSARVEADVVPCFEYHYYFSETSYREGAKIFRTNGSTLVNYSALQLKSGREKNNRTNQVYKKTVRILKRLENAMVSDGSHVEVPSFLVECLVYNCSDEVFRRATWTDVVTAVLVQIFEYTNAAEPDDDGRWVEVNEAKYLFSGAQKWTRQQARDFAVAGWNYLGLGDS